MYLAAFLGSFLGFGMLLNASEGNIVAKGLGTCFYQHGHPRQRGGLAEESFARSSIYCCDRCLATRQNTGRQSVVSASVKQSCADFRVEKHEKTSMNYATLHHSFVLSLLERLLLELAKCTGGRHCNVLVCLYSRPLFFQCQRTVIAYNEEKAAEKLRDGAQLSFSLHSYNGACPRRPPCSGTAASDHQHDGFVS
jgi:hypothetical protein